MKTILFSDSHVREGDQAGTRRVLSFLEEKCVEAERLYILGDLFDFWFGARQARYSPFKDVLDALKKLADSGTRVTFYHGNRDFYLGERTARRWGVRVVEDFSLEEICGRRVLLCHGDSLCINDLNYHRAKRILRHPLTRRIVRLLPAFVARSLARLYRAHSKRTVTKKARWVLGIDDEAVMDGFRRGADVVICGHTHTEGRRTFKTPDGERELVQLGDFGLEGSYIECRDGGLHLCHYQPSET
jgi:UDP-2,3-diacylglucosamine hydrolase